MTRTHDYKGSRYRVAARRLEVADGDTWRRVTRAEWDAIIPDSSLGQFRAQHAALTPPDTAAHEASRRASAAILVRVTPDERAELAERSADAGAPSLTAWVRGELGLPATPPRPPRR